MAKRRRNEDNPAAMNEPAASVGAERASGHSPEEIAARAYELYLARGGGHGQDWDDWLAAERELAAAATPRRDPSE